MAKGREVISEMYRSILAPFGLVEGKAKERKERRPVKVPPHLVDFVQITLFDAVQITPERERTDNKMLHVQPQPSFMEQRSTREERRTVVVGSDVRVLSEALQIDDDAAQKIFEGARKEDPTITHAELTELARIKLRQTGKRAENWVGLLISSVPKMVRGPVLGELRRVATDKAAAELRSHQDWQEWKTRMEADRAAGKLTASDIELIDSISPPLAHQNGHRPA